MSRAEFMLVTCQECSAKVPFSPESMLESQQAPVCPECGAPLPVHFGKTGRRPRSSSGEVNRAARGVSRKRVLIADDTYYFREVLSDQLSEAGYEVLLASDGEEALQIAKRELPNLDLLILDLKLPKMSGFDVLKEIRSGALGKDLQILCTSAVHNKATEVHATRELGANGFLTKEVPLEEFVTRVLKLVPLNGKK